MRDSKNPTGPALVFTPGQWMRSPQISRRKNSTSFEQGLLWQGRQAPRRLAPWFTRRQQTVAEDIPSRSGCPTQIPRAGPVHRQLYYRNDDLKR
ncbi:DUF397 domain-containing protein [Nocardia miyunensis]|uniref:DUF397 domain-containing protein n=1 Tax=Nocardia miyunensis TaxID=282684 RepID=UPI003F762D10